jgi:hypothetical protein
MVVIPYRASFFDCGCIDDLLRRLTSQEEQLRVSQSYLSKKSRWAARRQSRLFVYRRTVGRGNLVNVGETTKPKPKQSINYALHQKTLTVVAYLRRGRIQLSKKREKTSFIRISKNGLQVDLEEESSKGNYHIGG